MFPSGAFNQRTDNYGGSQQNRLRFLRGCHHCCRRSWRRKIR
ncbi:hypothetical protein [Cellvibrio sp. PSBB006]